MPSLELDLLGRDRWVASLPVWVRRGRLAGETADVILAPCERNSSDPPPEAVRLLQVGQALVRPRECVLGNILRVGVVEETRVRDGIDSPLVPSQEGREGILIATQRTTDEPSV